MTDYISAYSKSGHLFIPRMFQGFPEIKEALISNQMQAAFMVAPMAIALRAQGVPVKIVYLGHRYGSAVVDTSVPDWELKIPGRAPGLDLHYLPADKNNFAPRVSVAYEPQPGWVFRGGYGIFYDLGASTTAGQRMGDAFGGVPGYVGDFYGNFRFDAHDDVPVMSLDNIFPAPAQVEVGTYPISTGAGSGYFDYPASVRFLDQDSGASPYYHRFVVSTEKQIAARTAISLFYTGSRGRDLPYYENINAPAYRTGWPSEDAFNEARPNASGRSTGAKVRAPA